MFKKIKEINQSLKDHSEIILTAVGTRIVYWLGISLSAMLFKLTNQKALEDCRTGWIARNKKISNPTKMY